VGGSVCPELNIVRQRGFCGRDTMPSSRISLYVVVALVAVAIGICYLHYETPADRDCPINVIQLFTKANF